MENSEIKEVCIKNCTYCCFDDIIKFKDFDSDNILLDEKQYGNIFITFVHIVYNISYKTLIGSKPLRIRYI